MVGALGEDGGDGDSLNGAGAAYIFVRRTPNLWDGGTKISAPDPQAGNAFGWSVAMSGEYAIVGAPLGQTGRAAFVFRRASDTWNAESKLVALDGTGALWFGGSVAISDGNAIVGAHGTPLYSHDDAGSSYVY
jgi:hypothetical protein